MKLPWHWHLSFSVCCYMTLPCLLYTQLIHVAKPDVNILPSETILTLNFTKCDIEFEILKQQLAMDPPKALHDFFFGTVLFVKSVVTNMTFSNTGEISCWQDLYLGNNLL